MKPETVVARLMEKHGTQDPFEICQNENILVLRHPLGNIRGYFKTILTVDVIAVDQGLSPMAANFTCWHELGHREFDKGLNRVFMDHYTYMLPDKYEDRADRFAAHAMFGQPPLYQEPIMDWEMAEILNVPVWKVNARLLELSLYY